MTKELVYLASAYSHELEIIRNRRFHKACIVVGKLMLNGMMVFSPIVHGHPIVQHTTLPMGWEFWKDFNRLVISKCNLLLVLTINGWKESKGVNTEIDTAKELGIPIKYVDEQGIITDYPNEDEQ
jgi:hypothetical protein